jgi:hypothetical protein
MSDFSVGFVSEVFWTAVVEIGGFSYPLKYKNVRLVSTLNDGLYLVFYYK